MSHIIIAPHCDDEIIGCYEVLLKEINIDIYFTEISDMNRLDEATRLEEILNNTRPKIERKINIFKGAPNIHKLSDSDIIYAPDPVNEIHPAHRYWGNVAEGILRKGFPNVIFYSTIMNAPYIHEVKTPWLKEQLLDRVYPSQSDMWKYEKKYILFGGYCKWIMK